METMNGFDETFFSIAIQKEEKVSQESLKTFPSFFNGYEVSSAKWTPSSVKSGGMQPKLDFLEAVLFHSSLHYIRLKGKKKFSANYFLVKVAGEDGKFIEFFLCHPRLNFYHVAGWMIQGVVEIFLQFSSICDDENVFSFLNYFKCLKNKKVYSEKQDWEWTKLGTWNGLIQQWYSCESLNIQKRNIQTMWNFHSILRCRTMQKNFPEKFEILHLLSDLHVHAPRQRF